MNSHSSRLLKFLAWASQGQHQTSTDIVSTFCSPVSQDNTEEIMSISASVNVLLDGYTPSVILAVVAVLLLCWQRLSMKWDPQEPPILKPTIPFIGHIIGLFSKSHSAEIIIILGGEELGLCS